MAELLSSHASAFRILKKGEQVEATVSKVTGTEMFVQIDGKTEALVLEKDRNLFKQLSHLIKIGDSVTATVLSPENDMGMPVVSLRHFMEEKTWAELDRLTTSQEKLPVVVKETTKGGFLVVSETGISGFLPNSHVTVGENTEELVGKTISTSIVDVNREQNKVIFSQKGILTADAFKKATAHIKQGAKIHGVISGITSFGLFVSLDKAGDGFIDGLVHISEVSWEKVEDLSQLYSVGQEVDAVVVGIDAEAKRIDLSMKRLSADPFEKIAKEFPVDKKVNGVIIAIEEGGITVDLGTVDDESVEGFIKREKISPTANYALEQKINMTVTQIDNRKRKIFLVPVLLEKPLMYR